MNWYVLIPPAALLLAMLWTARRNPMPRPQTPPWDATKGKA